MRSVKRQKISGSPGFAFAMHEKWDKQMLKWILARPSAFMNDLGDVDNGLFTRLRDLKKKMSRTGVLEVEYFTPDAAIPFGIVARVFGKGLQTVPGWVRRLCSSKHYHDLDIVNCFPVLLLQLAQKRNIAGGDCLRRYVVDREDILEEDMRLAGVTRKVAKIQYLKVMFGSDSLDYNTAFLLAFKADIEHITEHLWRLQEFKHFRTYVQSSREAKSNLKGRFLSTVITSVEREIIDVAMHKSGLLGYKAQVYVFDGFMVEKRGGADDFPDECLLRLSCAVFEETGYKVSFVEKSLIPSVQDTEKLRPDFNNFELRSEWDREDVFDELQTVAALLNATPKEGNKAEFCKRLIPLMNKAFALVKDKFLLVAERRVKDGFVDYFIRKCKDAVEAHSNRSYLIKDGDKVVRVNPVEVWRKSQFALSYDTVTFNPTPYSMKGCASPDELNFFVGLAYAPTQRYTAEQMQHLRQTELKSFWDHVEKVWCSDEADQFNYTHNWLCSQVQRPWFRVEAALILRSDEGAGKGIVLDKVAEILGVRYLSKPPSLEDITGKSFNKLFFDRCLLMFLDEAFYAGSKATKNQIKTVITDPTVTIREKFLPEYTIPCYFGMVLASNEDHVINRAVKSRRYMCLSLSNEYAGNHGDKSEKRAYFDSISHVNPQVLSNYMHSVDLVGWSGRDIPATLEGERQGIKSDDSRLQFIHEVLENPCIIHEARLEYQNTAPILREDFAMSDNADLLSGIYVRSSFYAVYSRRSNGFKYREQDLYEQLKGLVPDFKLLESRPTVRGKREQLIQFPLWKKAQETYKMKRNLKKFSFE